MNNLYFRVRWSVSRGRETYGCNICTVECTSWGTGNIKGQCKGGGYDMVATSLAIALEQVPIIAQKFYDFLRLNQRRVYQVRHAPGQYQYAKAEPYNPDLLYGAFLDLPNNSASFDGGCGLSSLISAYAAAGVTIRADHNKKGQTIGFFVSWEDEQNA